MRRLVNQRDEFCPISEIPWDEIFNQRQPGRSEPDPEGGLMGIDLLVSRYRAAYPARDSRGDWIEARLRAWWRERERG